MLREIKSQEYVAEDVPIIAEVKPHVKYHAWFLEDFAEEIGRWPTLEIEDQYFVLPVSRLRQWALDRQLIEATPTQHALSSTWRRGLNLKLHEAVDYVNRSAKKSKAGTGFIIQWRGGHQYRVRSLANYSLDLFERSTAKLSKRTGLHLKHLRSDTNVLLADKTVPLDQKNHLNSLADIVPALIEGHLLQLDGMIKRWQVGVDRAKKALPKP